MESAGLERDDPHPQPQDQAARKRAAVETYTRYRGSLSRTARRYSLCEDDAEDALQRALEILLRKAPSVDPRELVRWMQTVVKHEALAVRRERERILAPPAGGGGTAEDWLALVPSPADGPAERAERREAIARSREALRSLKPQELRALTLLAEGYSYAEIGEITSWSQTKINRCLAEGRERFRRLLAGSEDGRRCAEMQPLLSAFCDGEADGAEVVRLREHLRACSHCRATMRAYRAVPPAAAALAPVLPLHRSLWERVGDALQSLTGRFGGAGRAENLAQVASGGGGAGLAKVAAVCIATAGGAAACAAGGLLPAVELGGGSRPALPRQDAAPVLSALAGELGPRAGHRAAGSSLSPAPETKPAPAPDAATTAPRPAGAVAEPTSAPAQPAATAVEPAPAASEGSAPSAVEAPPPPAPAPAPEPAPAPPAEPTASSGGGSPAGEFGP